MGVFAGVYLMSVSQKPGRGVWWVNGERGRGPCLRGRPGPRLCRLCTQGRCACRGCGLLQTEVCWVILVTPSGVQGSPNGTSAWDRSHLLLALG